MTKHPYTYVYYIMSLDKRFQIAKMTIEKIELLLKMKTRSLNCLWKSFNLFFLLVI